MNSPEPSPASIIFKTAITHTVTYFMMGIVSFLLLDYAHLYAETDLRFFMRQTTEPLVMAGPLFQPLRGILFGLVFVLLRPALFAPGRSWLVLWITLVGLGIFGTFGPAPASIEGMIYTTLPLRLHLIGLPEVLIQSLLLSVIVYYWVNHPGKKWLRVTMWSLFSLVLVVAALGVLAAHPK